MGRTTCPSKNRFNACDVDVAAPLLRFRAAPFLAYLAALRQSLGGTGLERGLFALESVSNTKTSARISQKNIEQAAKAKHVDLVPGKCDMSTNSRFEVNREACSKIKELPTPNSLFSTRASASIECAMDSTLVHYHFELLYAMLRHRALVPVHR